MGCIEARIFLSGLYSTTTLDNNFAFVYTCCTRPSTVLFWDATGHRRWRLAGHHHSALCGVRSLLLKLVNPNWACTTGRHSPRINSSHASSSPVPFEFWLAHLAQVLHATVLPGMHSAAWPCAGGTRSDRAELCISGWKAFQNSCCPFDFALQSDLAPTNN